MQASLPSLSNTQKLAISLFKLYGLIMTLVFLCLVLGKLGIILVAISPVVLVMIVALCCAIFIVATIFAMASKQRLNHRPAPLLARFPPNAPSKQDERPPRSAPKK